MPIRSSANHGIEIGRRALHAQQAGLNATGHNIANANTTNTPDGGPYQRQTVRFETILKNEFDPSNAVQEVRVAGIEKDTRPARLVYQPGHPDADPESGMVKFPNVSVHEEMADLISSSRATEANLAIIRTARQMALQTLDIGK